MAASQATAPPLVQRTASCRAGLRRASLATLILIIAQFGLGMGVNLHVTLPSPGHPGHGSFFANGPLLALHAALGMFLILSAVSVLVRAIRTRSATLMATSAAGLMAAEVATFFGSGFTGKLTNGYSPGMALAAAAALACYAVGLYAASTGHGRSSRPGQETAGVPGRPGLVAPSTTASQ